MTNLIPQSLVTRLISPNPFICRSCLSRAGRIARPAWAGVALGAKYSTDLEWADAASSSSPSSSSPSPSPSSPSPSPLAQQTTKQGRRQSRTNQARQHMSRIRNAQRPESFLSKDDLTSPDPDYDVRFFEQFKAGQIRELPDEDAFNDSFNNLPPFPDVDQFFDNLKQDGDLAPFRPVIETFQQSVKAQLDGIDDPDEKERRITAFMNAMQEQIGSLAESPEEEQALEKLKQDLDSPHFLDGLDEKKYERDARKHEKDAMKYEQQQPGKAEQDGRRRQEPPPPMIPPDEFTPRERVHIARLNATLRSRAKVLDRDVAISAKALRVVWKAYYGARPCLAKMPKQMPLDAWTILWKIICQSSENDPYRMAHLAVLAQDMIRADIALSPAQQLLAIEAVFVTQARQDAVNVWRKAVATLGAEDATTFREFWELGARMYCRMNDTDRAGKAVDKLVGRGYDARIMQCLIRAYMAQGTEQGDIKAWETYRSMRQRLAASMSSRDYDETISCFIIHQRLEFGLWAFVDMISEGSVDVATPGRPVVELPHFLANKFFFGKWTKRLVLTDDPDGAHAVARFMMGWGVQAAPIQINTIIGAFQRLGRNRDLERADELAWGMIYSRQTFVRNRSAETTLPTPMRLTEPMLSRVREASLPPANLETFKLLAESYRARNLHSRQAGLWENMLRCELRPDTFLMNKILESYARENQATEAYRFYHTLMTEFSVRPDVFTLNTLWRLLAINRRGVASEYEQATDIKEARALFVETLRIAADLKASFHDSIARLILHSFQRLSDGAGVVVVLRSLRAVFGYIPSDILAVELLLGARGLTLETVVGRNRIRGGLRTLATEVGHMRARGRARGDASMLNKETGELVAMYLESKYMPRNMDETGFWEVAHEMGAGELLAGGQGDDRVNVEHIMERTRIPAMG